MEKLNDGILTVQIDGAMANNYLTWSKEDNRMYTDSNLVGLPNDWFPVQVVAKGPDRSLTFRLKTVDPQMFVYSLDPLKNDPSYVKKHKDLEFVIIHG